MSFIEQTCVACGEHLDDSHKCSEKFERKRQAADRARHSMHVHTPQFYERLSTGFWMLSLSER